MIYLIDTYILSVNDFSRQTIFQHLQKLDVVDLGVV